MFFTPVCQSFCSRVCVADTPTPWPAPSTPQADTHSIWADTPPPADTTLGRQPAQTATEAASTHPTGMHSC